MRTGCCWQRSWTEPSRRRGATSPQPRTFCSPQQQALALDLLRRAGVPERAYLRTGGYDGAERALILFLPDWMEPESAESPIRCLRTVFRVEEKVNHRDLLGSLMGLGIVREKVGDILVGPDSADLLVLDTVTDFLLSSWTSAGRAKLTVAEIDPSHLHMPEIKCEEVRDTVSSLRLDAVGLHRLPDGPEQSGGPDRLRPGAGELEGVYRNRTSSSWKGTRFPPGALGNFSWRRWAA